MGNMLRRTTGKYIAAELGVSVTPVREALLTLRGEGMVDLEPHRGVQRLVRDLNHTYRHHKALHELDFDPYGFEWLVAAANLAALILIGVVADLAGLPLWVVSALVLIPMYALVGLAAWHARDARAVSAS